MLKSQPLSGKTVVVTGSSVTTTVLQKIEQLGGEAIACPLIQTVEIIEPYDYMQLEMARNFDWLIFTSQNGVETFCAKMNRHHFTPADFSGKIAAVGSKTRKKLISNGFTVHFVPSVFSADVFVKEFPKIAEPKSSCLFVRGKKARDTIKEGLPFNVKEWNVYDTEESSNHLQKLKSLIENRSELLVIFASPSAVDAFAIHIAPSVGWDRIKIASIGHITSNALKKHGAHVTYQPNTYTMESVLDEIIK